MSLKTRKGEKMVEDRQIRDWLGAVKYAGLIGIEFFAQYIIAYLKWANE